MSHYYPPVAFSFSVTLVGEVEPGGMFQEVSGLDAEREVKEINEGGEDRIVHRLPSRVKAQNLILKRGTLNANGAFFDWIKETLEGDLSKPIAPKTVTVALLDQTGQGLMCWTVSRAWPVKWVAEAIAAKEQKIAIETLELAFTDLERQITSHRQPGGDL